MTGVIAIPDPGLASIPDSVKVSAFERYFTETDVIHFIIEEGDFEFTYVNPAFRREFGNSEPNHPRLLNKDEWKTDETEVWAEHNRIAFETGEWEGIERVPSLIGYEVNPENPMENYWALKERCDPPRRKRFLFCSAYKLSAIEKLKRMNKEWILYQTG